MASESEFPSNSKSAGPVPKTGPTKPAEEEKQITVLATEGVIQRKKPWHRKLKESFVGDERQGVGSYVAFDIIVPAIKDTIVDAVNSAVEGVLFPEGARSSRSRGRRSGGSTSYNNMFPGPIRDPREALNVARGGRGPAATQRTRSMNHFDEIILPDRATAVAVLDQMYEMLSRYNVVTVSDLYAMVNITPAWTDRSWGWDDLEGSTVRRLSHGEYLLDLSRPEHLG